MLQGRRHLQRRTRAAETGDLLEWWDSESDAIAALNLLETMSATDFNAFANTSLETQLIGFGLGSNTDTSNQAIAGLLASDEFNIFAVARSEYTSRPWDDSLFTGWGEFVLAAYEDVRASGVFQGAQRSLSGAGPTVPSRASSPAP